MRSHGQWRLVASAGLFVAVVAVMGMSPASAQEAAEPAPAASQEDPAAAARLLELVNHDRAAAGLHPLSARADVASVAAAWSKDMAARQVLAHNDAYFTAESRRTHGARSLGENVAYNGSVDDAHARLMASPGHRANLLSDRFSVVGMAAVHDGTTWWITQNFVEPVEEPAPAAAAAAAPAAPAAPAPAAPATGDVTVTFEVPPTPAPAPAAAPAAAAPVDEPVTAAAPAAEQATQEQEQERALPLRTTASSSPAAPTAAVPAVPGAVAALAVVAVGAATWRRRPMGPMVLPAAASAS